MDLVILETYETTQILEVVLHLAFHGMCETKCAVVTMKVLEGVEEAFLNLVARLRRMILATAYTHHLRQCEAQMFLLLETQDQPSILSEPL